MASSIFVSYLLKQLPSSVSHTLRPLDYMAFHPLLELHQLISLYQRAMHHPQRLMQHWKRMTLFFAACEAKSVKKKNQEELAKGVQSIIFQLCRFSLPIPTTLHFDRLQLTHARLRAWTPIAPFSFASTPRANVKWRTTFNQPTWEEELKGAPNLTAFLARYKVEGSQSNVTCFLGRNGGNFRIPPEKRDILTYLCMKSWQREQQEVDKRLTLVRSALQRISSSSFSSSSSPQSLWSVHRSRHYKPLPYKESRHTLNEISDGSLSRFIIDLDMSFPLLGEYHNVEQWLDPCAPQPALGQQSLLGFLKHSIRQALVIEEKDATSLDLSMAVYSASGVVCKDDSGTDMVYPRDMAESFCKPSFSIVFPKLCMTPATCKQLTILLQRACARRLGRLFTMDTRIMDDQIHDGVRPHTRMLYCDKAGYVVCAPCLGTFGAGQPWDRCLSPHGSRCFRTFAGRPVLPYAWIEHDQEQPTKTAVDWSMWCGASYRSCQDSEKAWILKTLVASSSSTQNTWSESLSSSSATLRTVKFKPRDIPRCLPTDFWTRCYTMLRTPLLESTSSFSSQPSAALPSSPSFSLPPKPPMTQIQRLRAQRKQQKQQEEKKIASSTSTSSPPTFQTKRQSVGARMTETIQSLYLAWIKNFGSLTIPYPSHDWAQQHIKPSLTPYWGKGLQMDTTTPIRLKPTTKGDTLWIECLARRRTATCLRKDRTHIHSSNQSVMQLASFGISLGDYSCKRQYADASLFVKPPPQALFQLFFISIKDIVQLVQRCSQVKEFLQRIRM